MLVPSPGPETDEYAGCLSAQAVYPLAPCITPKIVLVLTKFQGYTGAQPFIGSRGSFAGSMELMPPPPLGAPPFSWDWSMSIPSSYSVVVPFSTPGVQVPAATPLPVVLAGGAS